MITAITGLGALMLYSIAGETWSPWAWKHLALYGVLFRADGRAGHGRRSDLVRRLPTRPMPSVYPHAPALVLPWWAIRPWGPSAGSTSALRLQPSEMIKIGLVLALARFYNGLTTDQARFSWWLLIPLALIGAPAAALVAHQPDLGTPGTDRAHRRYRDGARLGSACVSFWAFWLLPVAIVPLAFMFVLKAYQRARLLTFLNPEADRSGAGYHIIQSKIALGSGGLLGEGLGLGTQSPEAQCCPRSPPTSYSRPWPKNSVSSAAPWCWSFTPPRSSWRCAWPLLAQPFRPTGGQAV